MKQNMKQWLERYINSPTKKAMPILSFPGVQIIGHTVEELVKSGELQAQCTKAIAERFDTGAAFSRMDLSVEAESLEVPQIGADYYTADAASAAEAAKTAVIEKR